MTRALVVLGIVLIALAGYDVAVANGVRANVAFAFSVLAALVASVVVLSVVLGRAGADHAGHDH